MKEDWFNLNKNKKEFEEFKINFPKKLSKSIVESIKTNFDEEGFNKEKWQERKYDYKTKQWSKPILGGRDSRLGSGLEIISEDFDKIIIRITGEAEAWAWVHNEGDKTHPVRKILGEDDEKMNKIIEEEINREIDKIFD